MRVGAFDVDQPVRELHDVVAIAILKPWVNVGNVGTIGLRKLSRHLETTTIGRLARPGEFFDFTRYRPEMRSVGGRRVISKPNAVVRHASDTPTGRDFLLLDLWEPHMLGEDYIESVVELLNHFGVREYCRIGGMYDSVPHTRPLPVTGSLTPEQTERAGSLVSQRGRGYQGPTSILSLVPEMLDDSKVTTTSLMVHMPHYVQLDDDHTGASRLLEVLCSMYGFPRSLSDTRRGQQQYRENQSRRRGEPRRQGAHRTTRRGLRLRRRHPGRRDRAGAAPPRRRGLPEPDGRAARGARRRGLGGAGESFDKLRTNGYRGCDGSFRSW